MMKIMTQGNDNNHIYNHTHSHEANNRLHSVGGERHHDRSGEPARHLGPGSNSSNYDNSNNNTNE